MRISDWSSDVCSSDLSLLDSTEFVTRLTRVAQLWHYVLIARALAFFSFAFFPGISGFLTASWQGPAMAAGIGCDLVLTTWPARRASGRVKLPRPQNRRSDERRVRDEGVRSCRSRWTPD